MNCLFETNMNRWLQLGIKMNESLSSMTGFRVGGPAAGLIEIGSLQQLVDAVVLCNADKIPFHLIGNGTNLLASDNGFEGLILRFNRPLFDSVYDGDRVHVSAGMSLSRLAKESLDHGLMGLERLHGIPGTVGGACAMNAGAYGTEISDVLVRVRVLHCGNVQWMEVNADDLGYRRSKFSFPEYIVLEAELQLHPDDGTARNTLLECYAKRKEKQPLEYPSGGSTFKRPEGNFAGALIEQCGLKGLRIGGAQVSEKHAGFIINRDHASEKDITELITLVQQTVEKRTGVHLECEIKRL